MEKKRKKIKVLGVCGGNGVILHPLKRHVIGNIEDRKVFMSPKNQQWYDNFKVPFTNDLRVAEFLFQDVDVIIGAPNCGASSILGFTGNKKRKNPIDDESVQLFFESVLKYQPKIWVMENLPAMLNNISRASFKDLFPDYRFIFHVMNMGDIGNSQVTRKRLLIVAMKRELPAEVFMEFSELTRTTKPASITEILKGLEEDNESIGNVRENPEKSIKMGNKSFTFEEIQTGWLKTYKKSKYWPLSNNKKDKTFIPGVYRLFPDDYPQTVRQDPRQFRPDGLPMSPRELARIQGVPDKFKLHIPKDGTEGKEQSYYINKARITVAKGAPYEVGEWVARKLKAIKKHL